MKTARLLFLACCASALCLALAACAQSDEPSVYERITATPENIATTSADPWAELGQNVQAEADESLRDGTYTGSGLGMEGKITVTLEVKDNRIACISMEQDGETPGMSGFEAIRDGKYAQLVEAAQGPEIDNIAGATITTLGVKAAVEDALSQARG